MSNFNFQDSFHNVLNRIIGWIPNIVEFLVVIIIGYFVALIASWIVRSLLRLAHLDEYLERGTVGQWISRAVYSPTRVLGKITFWVVWFGSWGVAAALANLPLIGQLVSTVFSYLPNVLSALFIFVLAVAVSAIVVSVVKRTMADTPTGKIVASAVPVIVMSMAGFAILNALEISPEIVQITYAAMMGSLALGLALAFGLGGREVAAKMLGDAYEQSKKHTKRAKKDFQTGADRGKKEFDKFKRQQRA